MIIKDGGVTKKNHLEDYLDGNERFEIRLEREKKLHHDGDLSGSGGR